MLPRKDPNHESQPSRGTEWRSDEEQTMARQNGPIKITGIQAKKICNRGTALELSTDIIVWVIIDDEVRGALYKNLVETFPCLRKNHKWSYLVT